MEGSAAAKNLKDPMISSDGHQTSYNVSQRPVWAENELDNFVAAYNYDYMIKADT